MQNQGKCKKITNFLISKSPEINTITDHFNSMVLNIIFQGSVTLKNLILWFCSFGKISPYNWKWIPISLAGMVTITLIGIFARRFKKYRQCIGITVTIIQLLLYIEAHLLLKSDSMILLNSVLGSVLLVSTLTETMRRSIFAFIIFTLYELYILFILLFRNPVDLKTYPLWHLLVNLLYNFITVSTCLFFCINSKNVSLEAILKLSKTTESWKNMMDNICMPIAIIENGKFVYKNKICQSLYTDANQIKLDELFTCSLYEGNETTLFIDNNKYSVTREAIFFSDKLSTLYTLHDITSVIKSEEDKFTQRLVATVTHELRNPLSVMLATYDILSSTANKEQKEIIRKGMIAGKMQENLINDILDVAKINSNKLILCPSSTNLKESVTEIIDMLQFIVNKTKIQLSCNIDSNFPDSVDIDDRRFKQIVINLLSNSIKFTKVGQIILDLKYSSNLITCQVSDTGVGIPMEDQSIIFEKFGMAKSTMILNKSGTGLGLHLCKCLIEAMNGSICFHSEPNKLTIFEFIIPVVNHKSNEDTNSSREYFIPLEYAAPTSVLHIDDDLLSIYALKSFAKQLKLCENSYSSAQDALKDLENRKIQFSLAFIDINMPEICGYEVALKIREMGYKSCTLIALTGEDRNSIWMKCSEHGFNDVMEKPLSYLKYKQMVDSVSLMNDNIAIDMRNHVK